MASLRMFLINNFRHFIVSNVRNLHLRKSVKSVEDPDASGRIKHPLIRIKSVDTEKAFIARIPKWGYSSSGSASTKQSGNDLRNRRPYHFVVIRGSKITTRPSSLAVRINRPTPWRNLMTAEGSE